MDSSWLTKGGSIVDFDGRGDSDALKAVMATGVVCRSAAEAVPWRHSLLAQSPAVDGRSGFINLVAAAFGMGRALLRVNEGGWAPRMMRSVSVAKTNRTGGSFAAPDDSVRMQLADRFLPWRDLRVLPTERGSLAAQVLSSRSDTDLPAAQVRTAPVLDETAPGTVVLSWSQQPVVARRSFARELMSAGGFLDGRGFSHANHEGTSAGMRYPPGDDSDMRAGVDWAEGDAPVHRPLDDAGSAGRANGAVVKHDDEGGLFRNDTRGGIVDDELSPDRLHEALSAFFERQARLPPAGGGAFDPHLTPVWFGQKLPV